MCNEKSQMYASVSNRSSKRKARENVCMLLNGAGDAGPADTEHGKAEVLTHSFSSVFTSRTTLQKSKGSETRGKGWNKEDIPLVEQDQIKVYLSTVDIQKSMSPWAHTPISAEVAGSCHWETTLNKLWTIMVIGRVAWGLQESKCHSCLQEGKERGPREVWWKGWLGTWGESSGYCIPWLQQGFWHCFL